MFWFVLACFGSFHLLVCTIYTFMLLRRMDIISWRDLPPLVLPEWWKILFWRDKSFFVLLLHNICFMLLEDEIWFILFKFKNWRKIEKTNIRKNCEREVEFPFQILRYSSCFLFAKHKRTSITRKHLHSLLKQKIFFITWTVQSSKWSNGLWSLVVSFKEKNQNKTKKESGLLQKSLDSLSVIRSNLLLGSYVINNVCDSKLYLQFEWWNLFLNCLCPI